MGIIFSRFKEKTSTKEVLQTIEDEIKSLEEYKTSTQEWQKRILRKLVLYSILIYFFACLLWFFIPVEPWLKLYFYCGLVIFPCVIYVIRRTLTWHYRRSIKNNDTRLEELRDKKQQILEKIMETETYKVAREILEQFAPEQLGKHTPLKDVKNASQGGTPGTELRRRNAPQTEQQVPATPVNRNASMMQSPVFQKPVARPLVPPHVTGRTQMHPNMMHRNTPAPQQFHGQAAHNVSTIPTDFTSPRPGPPMPRPLLPRERGVMNRIVDYLVGDGPSNRYALICRQCESHNGMALKEEFEYLSYRCCYCHYWNPAKKQRPTAPRLGAFPTHSHPYPDITAPTVSHIRPPPTKEEEEDSSEFGEEEERKFSSTSSEEEEEEIADAPMPPPDVTLPSQLSQAQIKNQEDNDVSQMETE